MTAAAMTGVQPRKASQTLAELGWAAGSIGTSAIFGIVAIFALFFMTTFLGLAPALAGSAIFVAKIYDALFNPFIGAISDRTRHRWGPRRVYLLIGALTLGGGFAFFFLQPAFGGVASLTISFVVLVLWATAYSVFSVPYTAMAPDIVASYDGRTRLMTFRVFFMIAGVMAGSAGAPILVQKLGSGQGAYQIVGIVFGLLVTLTCLIGFVSAGYLPFRPVTGPVAPLSLIQPYRAMVSLFGSRPFRLLVGAKLCQLAVLSIIQACTPYFFLYVLRMSTGAIGTYLGLSTLVGIICLPIVRMAIARFGKKHSYVALLAVYVVGLASWMLWTPAEPAIFFYLRAAINGVLSVGTLLCVLAMLPDTMEYDRLTSGTERAGSMAGAFTLVEQLAGAVGPLVVGLLLEAAGLVQSKAANAAQPQSALTAIQLGMSIIPAALCLVALFLMRNYHLDAQSLADLNTASQREFPTGASREALSR